MGCALIVRYVSEMDDLNERNRKIIEEFRTTAGYVGGSFSHLKMLVLHTFGARTGQERLNPLAYQVVGGGWAIFASFAGGPRDPDWFHNLVANPDAVIEVGEEIIDVRARVVVGQEREPIWEQQKIDAPQFAGYDELSVDREIPVVLLQRR
jgi:deazaflavin-dependent oxidoreductase (nitroreductase family)